MKKIKLKIEGMHCASCAGLIELELQDKVKKMKIEEKGNAEIEFDEEKISKQEIINIINKLGYKTK